MTRVGILRVVTKNESLGICVFVCMSGWAIKTGFFLLHQQHTTASSLDLTVAICCGLSICKTWNVFRARGSFNDYIRFFVAIFLGLFVNKSGNHVVESKLN